MCRWITLISSDSVSLSDIVLAPSNSLVHVARDGSFHPGNGLINNSMMNGDGFGVGWYHTNVAKFNSHETVSHDGGLNSPVVPTNGNSNNPAHDHAEDDEEEHVDILVSAAVFKDITPAWNNTNLREICMATSSHCIMAHVRAASRNTGISHPNCHPFKAGRLLFCHNGRIDQFSTVRRRFLEFMTDEAYDAIRGTTDSECIFGLVLTNLAKDGTSKVSPLKQKSAFGPARMVAALKKTLNQIEHFMEQVGLTEGYSTCNFSLTDGDTMVVTRFCDKNPEIPPPSLYFAFGDSQDLYHELTNEEEAISATTHIGMAKTQSSSELTASETSSEDESSSQDCDNNLEEREVDFLEASESSPGKVMSDVNAATATFIVCSNPLTKTHTWHAMPRNSIMWCTRGKHPELRLLRHHKEMKKL